jgi:hypothetical protein
MTEHSENSKYIINIYKKDNENSDWIDCGSGFVFIQNTSWGTYLLISNYANKYEMDYFVYLNCPINDKLNVEYKESDNNSGYTVRFNNLKQFIGIKFDSNSSAAFKNFKETLEIKIKSKQEIIYYPSGNIMIVGQSVDGQLTGKGTAFYDNDERIIKYVGDFENGQCDGSGIFYSENKMIELEINNISNGKPIDTCKIIIKRKNDKKLIKHFDIKDIKIKYDIYEHDFCYKIAKYFLPNINELLFNDLSSDEKIEKLYKKMEIIEEKLDTIIKKQNSVSRGFFSFIISLFKY